MSPILEQYFAGEIVVEEKPRGGSTQPHNTLKRESEDGEQDLTGVD